MSQSVVYATHELDGLRMANVPDTYTHVGYDILYLLSAISNNINITSLSPLYN